MKLDFITMGLIVGGISAWFIQRYRLASKSVPLEKKEKLESQIKGLELEKARKEERINAKKAGENAIGLYRKCVELIPGHNNVNANKINVVFVGINLGTDELLKHSVTSVDYYGTKNGLMAIEPFKSNKIRFCYRRRRGFDRRWRGFIFR